MIITIARQCGCGAVHVGELLASQFNLVLYTRQMLFDLAKQKGILDEMRYFFEERPVDDFIMALSDNAEASDDVKQRFNKAFNRLIGDQDCIIIGRCGNSILPTAAIWCRCFSRATRLNALPTLPRKSKSIFLMPNKW